MMQLFCRSALVLCTVLLAACAVMKDRVQQLDNAQRAYEGAVRWGHFDIVYGLHRNDDGSTPIVPDNLANYRVSAYDVLSNSVAADESSAEQTIRIKYYHPEYMSEHTLNLRQHWVYDPQTNLWLVTSPPPRFE